MKHCKNQSSVENSSSLRGRDPMFVFLRLLTTLFLVCCVSVSFSHGEWRPDEFGTVRQRAAIAVAAEVEWRKIPQRESDCIEHVLSLRDQPPTEPRLTIYQLSQMGIFPMDAQAAKLRLRCGDKRRPRPLALI